VGYQSSAAELKDGFRWEDRGRRLFGYNSSDLWLLGLVATRSGGETDIFDALSGPLELDVGLLSACGDVKNCNTMDRTALVEDSLRNLGEVSRIIGLLLEPGGF
jgi:hypothetical protein